MTMFWFWQNLPIALATWGWLMAQVDWSLAVTALAKARAKRGAVIFMLLAFFLLIFWIRCRDRVYRESWRENREEEEQERRCGACIYLFGASGHFCRGQY